MNILSTISGLLFIILLKGSLVSAGDRIWPVKGNIDLSSNFCEYRVRHFHGGIDIRTGGTEGRRIYSPIDGYLWRVRYSYTGYGKALYLKDSEGFIYVFGHLSRLSDRLQALVEKIQYSSEKYAFDNFYPPDSLPVSAGELIAYSGQSGFGAPHIHFEIRNAENQPLNPLTNGFNLNDKQPPSVKAIGFFYQDSGSLFTGGQRHLIREVKAADGAGKYVLDEVVFVQGPFGIAINTLDRIRPSGPRLNIYRAKMYIDDYVYYETTFEKYDYAQTAMADLAFDYGLYRENKDYWLLFYDPPGKVFDGSRSDFPTGGIFEGRSEYSYGLHKARLEIYDAAGNKAEVAFEFFYAPPGRLFEVDWVNDSTAYLSRRAGFEFIEGGRIALYSKGRRSGWKPLEADRLEILSDGIYKVTLPAGGRRYDGVRVVVTGESGWTVVDRYLSMHAGSRGAYRLDYELVDGGILFRALAAEDFLSPPRVDIVYDDGYIKSLLMAAYDSDLFAAWYYDNRISSRIIRFDLVDRQAGTVIDSHEVSVALAGHRDEMTPIDGLPGLSVGHSRQSFYRPTLIEFSIYKRPLPRVGRLVGHVVEIGPRSVPLAGPLELAFALENPTSNTRPALYRLDDKNRWRWVDTLTGGDPGKAAVSSVGVYGLLEDREKPKIRNVYPERGSIIKKNRPRISCRISDDLSGFSDDTRISVRLDGQWLVPEYDVETERLVTYPREPLTPGGHELIIEAVDREGNRRRVTSHFTVKEG